MAYCEQSLGASEGRTGSVHTRKHNSPSCRFAPGSEDEITADSLVSPYRGAANISLPIIHSFM